MSNETSRVEAAAKAAHEAGDWEVIWTGDDWRAEVGRLEATAALAASDADDLANGIRRVRVDDATVERVANKLAAKYTEAPSLQHWRIVTRAVLAAATDGADG